MISAGEHLTKNKRRDCMKTIIIKGALLFLLIFNVQSYAEEINGRYILTGDLWGLETVKALVDIDIDTAQSPSHAIVKFCPLVAGNNNRFDISYCTDPDFLPIDTQDPVSMTYYLDNFGLTKFVVRNILLDKDREDSVKIVFHVEDHNNHLWKGVVRFTPGRDDFAGEYWNTVDMPNVKHSIYGTRIGN